MKEIYDWVPWFQKLTWDIAEGGEEYLIDRARHVEWGENPSLLQYGDEAIDPFSFFYFLASKNTTNQLKPVYDSVSHVFEIEAPPADADVDDSYIFPTPHFNILFHDGKNFHRDLLWRLYRQVITDDPDIAADEFDQVLEIKGVGVGKLTQTLFLVNPNHFLPVDSSLADLPEALHLPVPAEIESAGYAAYRSLLEKVRNAFPMCQPYEINMLLYLQKSGSIVVSDDYYQVSTQVMGQGKGDYWDEGELNFKKNNWVFTGGPGDDRAYRLVDPKPGDIIFVRTGREAGKGTGRAIGVVYQNDYVPDGWDKERRIHVLWINKSEGKLAGNTPILGFGKAGRGTETYKAFKGIESYDPSFDLLKGLHGSSTDSELQTERVDWQPPADTMNHLHPLNQILYGPPGTSKTWHTVNHALAIIDNGPVDQLEMENKGDREDKMRRFEALKKNGQIEMVTFHQNYNYEDFIEGIRPVLADDIDEEGKVEYELSRGVFREIGERARENWMRSQQKVEISWDMDDLLNAFGRSVDDRLDSEEQIDLFPLDRKRGTRIVNIRWLRDGQFKSVWAGTENSWRYLTKDVIKKHYMAFYDGEIKSEADIGPTRESKQTQHAHAHYYFALFQKIKEFHDNEWQPNRNGAGDRRQNYVLIIDEINRGNIAKIFGELITLIEESKRIGAG